MSHNGAQIGQLIQNGLLCWSHEDWIKAGFIHGFCGKCLKDYSQTKEKLASLLKKETVLELKQVHSNKIIDVDEYGVSNIAEAVLNNTPLEGDGLIFRYEQNKPFLAIIKTADCLPIIIKGSRRAAIVHAGWRGLASGIVQKGVEEVISKCANKALEVVIGPSACSRCYEVGEDVAKEFKEECLVEITTGKYLLNLIEAARLAVLSVKSDAKIYDSGICTIENKNFYSYRREREECGRNITFVSIAGSLEK